MRIGKTRCMRSRRPASTLISFVLLFSALGCSKESPSAILGHRELVDKTDIFIGSNQYYIQAKGAASREDDTEASSPNARVLLEESGVPTSIEVSEPAAKPNLKPGPQKPSKPKAKPVDIEYVLTKAKNISVGLTSDSPQARVQNDDVPFIPASITKIVTTAAALRTLGPAFKFKTTIGFALSPNGQASALVISADGDPTVGVATFEADSSRRMRDIAQAMKTRGVRELVGEVRLVSADPRLDVLAYAPGIPKEDMRECYGALSSSFNFHGNCALVRMNAKTGFNWESSEISRFITTSVSTVASDRTRLAIEPILSSDRVLQGFELQGSYAAKAVSVRQLRLPIGDGAAWFAQGLFAALREQKVTASKVTVSFARTPDQRSSALAVLASHSDQTLIFESAPLAEIVEATNKPSDNFFADSVFKALGSRSKSANISVVEASRMKIKEIFSDWLRADGHSSWMGDLTFYDGAGLSAENRATPRAFLAVLRRIALEPTFPALWQSLPIAGVDGTLESRMRNTAAAGVVRGKTGTLNGSYQLVGFIPKSRGGRTEYIPFVILTSTTARNRDLVRRFQDAIVDKMSESIARGE
jgi:serine-type D-Ala-D-Ala carboxypeptidase/endopeptidase (penicillin-binding protein 4)